MIRQHTSRWLQGRGMNWVDSEPAPPGSGAPQRADSGHGIFSFRTGSIYTAALLRQWVFRALGRRAASTECVQDKGAWHDPFRPLVPAGGHASATGCTAATRTTQKSRACCASATVWLPEMRTNRPSLVWIEPSSALDNL